MKQLGFYIDSSRCSGCKTCQVSCKDKNDIDVGRKFRRVYEYGGGSWAQDENKAWTNQTFAYYLSISCNHCDNPTCVAGCPTGAMHKREDNGLVLVDQDKCIGCKYCAMRCPYGAPQYDADKKVMSKCDGCIDLIEQGANPICVDSCPQRAIKFGDIKELRAKYGSQCDVAPLPDSRLTSPNLIVRTHAKGVSNKQPTIGSLQNATEVK
ncbi:MAG: dimethylsulfoxide reductase subunit B [Moritella sp.]|uniref:DMSO/selenate family reductase complex B subunit n=1 Tax=Moritella sp. TaxID=78556 RepID=UPI0029B260DC|nr:DMSO/selenate family reductase complex B subunit [Moritella sp.]MDX2320025.1 dimethylsulfoxide reductase subunit B [Moritella sp.]